MSPDGAAGGRGAAVEQEGLPPLAGLEQERGAFRGLAARTAARLRPRLKTFGPARAFELGFSRRPRRPGPAAFRHQGRGRVPESLGPSAGVTASFRVTGLHEGIILA